MHPKISVKSSTLPLVEESIHQLRQKPLLRGLMVMAAGYTAPASGILPNLGTAAPYYCFIYCVRGRGSFRVQQRPHKLGPGDLLVIPPKATFVISGAHANPLAFYWVQVSGDLIQHYFGELLQRHDGPVHRLGDNPFLIRLFNEVVQSSQKGTVYPAILRASAVMAHLLATIIQERHSLPPEQGNATAKIAEAIVYMDENLAGPVRVAELARLASFSPAYFTGLFKQQTGCAPRDYLHLLRIHRSCELLRNTDLSIKEVAGKVGYQDQFHFSRQFKAFHALSPTEYRASHTS